ncbi:MAG: type II toxin-antitoxin system RelE/ParE family toxin [Betaproteobacteria bacterium]|nr:type II toxin-antitoxin system RelE/ParE family toxin [Betaproteobacteria bacterium]MDE2210644.1 type II toxin-antitoxin system RelE/ParE family toxin [Betaproteobacteria bacterium]MDE2358523.1 type II toxin-antitoxin system RelE/ParE family toxin [Betaproteobacteria bacterium]
MIRTFRNKKLKRFYEAGDPAGLPPGYWQKVADILAAVDSAEQPSDVAMFPGWRLHPLKGEFTGFWAVSVSGNWRLVFRFEHGDAFDLDLVDYH